MNPFSTVAFKKLQKEWYGKLKVQGFNDIEDTNSPREYLKVWEDSYFKSKYRADIYLAKREYFSLSSQFLMTHSFITKRDKKIWNLHSQGYSLREIAKIVRISIWKTHTSIKLNRKIMLKNR